jgi:hypothetical protein
MYQTILIVLNSVYNYILQPWARFVNHNETDELEHNHQSDPILYFNKNSQQEGYVLYRVKQKRYTWIMSKVYAITQ